MRFSSLNTCTSDSMGAIVCVCVRVFIITGVRVCVCNRGKKDTCNASGTISKTFSRNQKQPKKKIEMKIIKC
jgi:hypothetical protein